MSQEHPEELLAGYVDGELSAEGAAQVQLHLNDCSVCRAEVELARSGLAALRALPELEPPELPALGRVAALPARDAERPRTSRSREPRRGLGRRAGAWAAGLAAAASVVGLLLLAQGGGLGGGAGQESTGGAGGVSSMQRAPSVVPIPRRAGGHTRASLDALVEGLSTDPSGAVRLPTPEAGEEEAGEVPSPTEAGAAPPGQRCVREAARLSSTARLLDLRLGHFEDRRAAIGLFVEDVAGGRRRVVVVAASRPDCRLLYVARRSL